MQTKKKNDDLFSVDNIEKKEWDKPKMNEISEISDAESTFGAGSDGSISTS